MGIQDQVEEHGENEAAYRAAMREGSTVALRSAAFWVPVASAVLLSGFYASRSTFRAADHLLADAGFEWDQAVWPAALYGIFGLAYGALIGWRITVTSGLVGAPAWRIGAAAVVTVCVIGVIGAVAMHGGAIPMLVWIGSGVMLFAALGSITFFANWNS